MLQPKGIQQFLNELQKTAAVEYSQELTDLISSSGDIAGNPFYHWRWKLKSLPDLVIWPQSSEDIVRILELAQKYTIAVTPRGGGTGFFGGATPTTGGILLDMKRMDQIQINPEKSIVHVQAGVSFGKLLQFLHRHQYTISAFPTSAPGATVGGWICTGGKIGLGTWQNGEFKSQIVQMTVVSIPFGKQTYTTMEDYDRFFESYGILGIITEISLSIVPSTPLSLISYTFTERNKLIDAVNEFQSLRAINTIYFASNPNQFFLILNPKTETYETDLLRLTAISNSNGFVHKELKPLPELNLELYNLEIKNKKDYPVLLFQHIFLPISQIISLLEYSDRLQTQFHIQIFWAIIPNKDGYVRLTLSCPTDNQYWEHFLACKGLLHKLAKFAYALSGRVYSYELQNSLFLLKYEPIKLKRYQQLKNQYDSQNILNPLKITQSKIRFSRINTMFELALFWRKLKVLVRKAEVPSFLNSTEKSAPNSHFNSESM